MGYIVRCRGKAGEKTFVLLTDDPEDAKVYGAIVYYEKTGTKADYCEPIMRTEE